HREGITAIRNRLLAEHLDVSVKAVGSAIRKWDSLIAAVEALSDGGRSLRPIDLSRASQDELTRAVGQIADPERPIEAPAFVGDLFGGSVEHRSFRRIAKLLLVAVAILALTLAWRYTPLRDLTDPATLVQRLEGLRQGLWMPLFVPLVFMLGGLI